MSNHFIDSKKLDKITSEIKGKIGTYKLTYMEIYCLLDRLRMICQQEILMIALEPSLQKLKKPLDNIELDG